MWCLWGSGGLILSTNKFENPFCAVGVSGETPHSPLAFFSGKPKKRTIPVSLSAKASPRTEGMARFFAVKLQKT
jgi:hypothetical protein